MASTDIPQLLILVIGLWLVVPVVLESQSGISQTWHLYQSEVGWQFPTGRAVWQWWDYALLLVFGGIPWQVYFQRVLSAKDEASARNLSYVAAVVCLIAAVPAVVIGMVGAVTNWEALGLSPPDNPALILPHVLRYLTSPLDRRPGTGSTECGRYVVGRLFHSFRLYHGGLECLPATILA